MQKQNQNRLSELEAKTDRTPEEERELSVLRGEGDNAQQPEDQNA